MHSQESTDTPSSTRKAPERIVSSSALSLGETIPMASLTLLQIMEELLQSIEQRDAGDPDAPAWEASVRIQRLEEELARRLGEAGAERGAAVVASVEAHQAKAALAGIA
jgi:hypothetical protein